MSAEILRRAASLMRERAEAATPGPWEAYRRHCGAIYADDFIGVCATDAGDFDAVVVEDRRWAAEDAEHIASWHPAVALAVAGWLTRSAEWLDRHPANATPDAVAVARAYLGEDA